MAGDSVWLYSGSSRNLPRWKRSCQESAFPGGNAANR